MFSQQSLRLLLRVFSEQASFYFLDPFRGLTLWAKGGSLTCPRSIELTQEGKGVVGTQQGAWEGSPEQRDL